MVGEPVDAVRHRLDGVPGEALGLIEERAGARGEPRVPVPPQELPVTPLARQARGHLRAHVTQHLARHADVLVDEVEDGLGRLAAVVEADGRDAETLLEDLRRVAAVAARGLPADVQLVADAGRPPDQVRVHVDRLQDVEIGQVRAALEGVVEDEDVARLR